MKNAIEWFSQFFYLLQTRRKSNAKDNAANATHGRTGDGTGKKVGNEEAVGEIPDPVVVAHSDCLTDINGVSEAGWEDTKNDDTYEVCICSVYFVCENV
uniref:Uncharacterized protein n=1 Tax=Ascaris lumbricoides TaxID=6252 RepID=A0A0M3HL05_ASCLU